MHWMPKAQGLDPEGKDSLSNEELNGNSTPEARRRQEAAGYLRRARLTDDPEERARLRHQAAQLLAPHKDGRDAGAEAQGGEQPRARTRPDGSSRP